MHRPNLIIRRPAGLSSVLIICAAALGGCAPGSAYNESAAQDQFFDKIGNECSGHAVGNESIYELVNGTTSGSYFLDVTSKLYYGEISTRQYQDDINSFFPGTTQAAIDCILARVPKDPPPKPGMPLGLGSMPKIGVE